MTRVLVTGASGFLGGAIVRRLAERDDIVLLPDIGDLANPSAMAPLLRFARPDIVVHAAGRTAGGRFDLLRNNILATEHLARAISLLAPDCGLVLLGSAAQYGASMDRRPWREGDPCEPTGDYGWTKHSAEISAVATVAKVAALRLFNVVAPCARGGQAFAAFLQRSVEAMRASPPRRVPMGPLGAVRDFVRLTDVLTAVERVIDRETWGRAINVCSGRGRTVRELVAATAARIDPALTIDEADEAGGLDWSVGDPALCQALLGFTPSADLSDLIEAAANWVLASAREDADAGSGA